MTRIPSLTEIDAELCRRDFYRFVVSAWNLVEPDTKFVDNWHLKLICDYLQALMEDRISSNNLMINIPPRHGKSLLVNVFFPAWVWTRRAGAKFLCFSYSENLTIRDSMKCRLLIGSPWYQERFHIQIDPKNDQKAQFNNLNGGYRFCFGMGGSIAGQGGDFLLIDDPLEISKANSQAARETVNFTYDNSISNRGNDPQTVKKVIIMQRLHEEDLCGHVAEKDDPWEQLILPAEYDGIRFVSSIGATDPRTEMGDLLWPARFGAKQLKAMKSTLGERGVAGQLQQRPAPLVGGIFKKEWFNYRVQNVDVVARYISIDTASSISEDAAYTSMIVSELTSDYRLFIRYVHRDKYTFPQLIPAIKDLATVYRANLKGIIIESKSSGISAIQTLAQAAEDWISELLVSMNPTTDKIDRASKAAVWCQNGSILLPPATPDFPWLNEFEDELFIFPGSRYKDQVDSLSQLILYLEHYIANGYECRSQPVQERHISFEAVL